MIIPPYIFVNDILKSYHTYLICKDNKHKFIICMNNYINGKSDFNCNEIYEIIKYKCN